MAEHELNKIVDDDGEVFNLRDSTKQPVADRVTAWGSTPSDTKYPSEKLVKTSLDAKATDSAVLHKAGLETASGQKWFEGGFCVFNTSNVGYGHYTLPGTGAGTKYDSWPEEYKDGAHFREWRLSFNTGINFWGKIRITIATSYSSFNASGSMQKTINCAFNTATVFNNTGYYNDLGINSEKEFRISDLIWNNTTACWEIKIHSIKPTSNNTVPVLLIEFWTYSTTNRDSALGIHWVSTTPDIVTDTTYYTKRSGNASTTPGTGGVQFNWEDTPVQQSPYGYEIFNRSHTIPIGNGGTGKTTAKAAEYNLTTGKSEISDNTSGDDRVVFELASPSESNGVTRGFRKLSTIWTWIKGLLSSESGVNISGNAATATALASGSADRTKLDGIAAGAEVNVQSDWNQATTTADDYIKNKPTLGTAAAKDVPTSGNASNTQVVMGNDSRLTNSRTPTSHASSATTYGVGTTSNYGHVKLATGDMNGATHADGVAVSKNHTHSQYLTSHQSIAGKMNTDASNAVAPSEGGTGATATLLNNLSSTGLDDISSDNVCIPTTNSDGSNTNKWYKRPLSKLWPWITSHTQTRILKTSSDVYWGVGADSTHTIDLDYDGRTSSPKMGVWVRWGSGSDNAKYMAECDASGNCTFNGKAASADSARYAYNQYYVGGGTAYWIKIGRVTSSASSASAGGALTAIISSGFNTAGEDLSAQIIRVSIRSKGQSTNGVTIVGDNVTLGLKNTAVNADVRFAVHTVTSRTTSVNGIYDIYVEKKGWQYVDVLQLHNDNVSMTYNSDTTKAISDTTNMTIFSPSLPYAGSAESANSAVSATELRIPYGSGSAYLQIGVSGSYLALGTNMTDGVMVNYAGEASQAAVAGRLGTTSVGSASNPIYLNNGIPTACNWWVS